MANWLYRIILFIFHSAMSDQSLVPYSCEVYKRMAEKSFKHNDVGSTHFNDYLKPVLQTLLTAGHRHSSLIMEVCYKIFILWFIYFSFHLQRNVFDSLHLFN